MPLGVPELLHDGLAWPALLSRHCKMAQGSQPPEGTRQNVTVRRIARRTVVVMRRQLRVTLTLMLILTLTVTLTLILTLTPIDTGSCQDYGPSLGTLRIRCLVLRTQKGTLVLTTTHTNTTRFLSSPFIKRVPFFLLFGCNRKTPN